jgi:two-component system, NtrC family, response regulator AtoC
MMEAENDRTMSDSPASTTRNRAGLALIIEDNATLVAALEALLDDEGYRTRTARSVAGARERLLASKPDVAILDLRLTDGSGEELLPELAVAGIPTVIVSTSPLARAIAERYGVELIAKPFDLSNLISAINRARTGVAGATAG